MALGSFCSNLFTQLMGKMLSGRAGSAGKLEMSSRSCIDNHDDPCRAGGKLLHLDVDFGAL